MSQLKRIVVGHDFREGGEIALESAALLAKRCGAALRLVHVVEPHHLYQRISHPLTDFSVLDSRNRAKERSEVTGARGEPRAYPAACGVRSAEG